MFDAATKDELEAVFNALRPVGSHFIGRAPHGVHLVHSHVTESPYQSPDRPTVETLSQILYKTFYTRSEPIGAFAGPDDLTESLSAANASIDRMDRGWALVDTREDGVGLLQKSRKNRLEPPERYRLDASTDGAKPAYAIHARRGDSSLQRGFYFAYGNHLPDQIDELLQGRFYLALDPKRAVDWMRRLTETLNAWSIPFTLKMLKHLAQYGRADAGVLYLPRRYASVVAPLLMSLRNRIGGLFPREPWMTRTLAPGLAYADNPPGGESFGLTRMRLVAEALVRLGLEETVCASAFIECVVKEFQLAGVDPKKPHLNPGNADIVVCDYPADMHPGGQGESDGFLDAALQCGRRLLRDRISANGQSVWPTPSDLGDMDLMPRTLVLSDATLHSGSAGIGLFLARLGSKTDDGWMRRVAVEAIRYAAASMLKQRSAGAWTGLAGVFCAAAHIAELLRSDEVAALANRLGDALVSGGVASATDNDAFDGRAGVLLAVLNAPKAFRTQALLGLADRLADRLVSAARTGPAVCYWESELGGANAIHGYAHGQSGIASALAVHARVSDCKLSKETAAGAFAFEASAYDPRRRNWPDHRMSRDDGAAHDSPDLLAWCNGAAGCLLALARHAREAHEDVINAALAATVDWLAASVDDPNTNMSLCHGFAGNLAVCAEAAIDKNMERTLTDLKDLAEKMLVKHEYGPWPSGVSPALECPGLMLGFAGTGHAYLTLSDPSAGSPFLI